MNNMWIILAQAGSEEPAVIIAEPVNTQTEPVTVVPGTPTPQAPAAPVKKPEYINLVLLGLMFVVMYLLLFRAPRKKQQQHMQMVKSLQKNDKVQTIGGIIGTVVDVKPDEITLKVDENNNTKIKVVPSAIGRSLLKEGNQ